METGELEWWSGDSSLPLPAAGEGRVRGNLPFFLTVLPFLFGRGNVSRTIFEAGLTARKLNRTIR